MFYELTRKMNDVYAAKNMDYSSGDPLGNFKRSADELGITPFMGVLVRMSDKWARITNIIKKGMAAVKDETVEDTLLDCAVYALIAIIVRREEKK